MGMKVYIWENVLTDYTDGMMVAVAENIEEARKAILAVENTHYILTDLNKRPIVLDPATMKKARGFLVWGGG